MEFFQRIFKIKSLDTYIDPQMSQKAYKSGFVYYQKTDLDIFRFHNFISLAIIHVYETNMYTFRTHHSHTSSNRSKKYIVFRHNFWSQLFLDVIP